MQLELLLRLGMLKRNQERAARVRRIRRKGRKRLLLPRQKQGM